MAATQDTPTFPLSFFSTLHLTFLVYRACWWKCLVLAALPVIPLLTWGIIAGLLPLTRPVALNNNITLDMPSPLLLVLPFILVPMQLALAAWSTAALTYLGSEALFGTGSTLRHALAVGWWRMSAMIGGHLLLLVMNFVALGLVVGLAVTTRFLPLLVLFVPMVYLSVATQPLLVPILTLERVRAPQAVQRSWQLGKARFWFFLGLRTVITFGIGAAYNFIVAPISLVLQGLALFGDSAVALLLAAAVILLFTLLTFPIVPLLVMVYYYDIRVRLEDFNSALEAAGGLTARPHDIESPSANFSFNLHDGFNIFLIMAVSSGVIWLISRVVANLPNLLNTLPSTGR